jgi:hypothetical protein
LGKSLILRRKKKYWNAIPPRKETVNDDDGDD